MNDSVPGPDSVFFCGGARPASRIMRRSGFSIHAADFALRGWCMRVDRPGDCLD
jgi:hypothetical protein